LPRNPAELRQAGRPNSRLLFDFVALAEAPAAQIEAYAKQWGVLGLCCHGVPTGRAYGFHLADLEQRHHRVPLPPSASFVQRLADEKLKAIPEDPPISVLPGQLVCGATRREPLERWRTLARVFDGHLDNIERLLNNPQSAPYVVAHLNDFAATFGHLRPVVVQAGSSYTLRLAGSLAMAGLAAALAYQLMIAVTGGNGWLICAECGKWFESGVWRSPDRAAYCQKCGRAAAMRAASRNYYKRKVQRKK
jgi:hypothetical protein